MHDCDEKQEQHSLYPNNTGMLHEILKEIYGVHMYAQEWQSKQVL